MMRNSLEPLDDDDSLSLLVNASSRNEDNVVETDNLNETQENETIPTAQKPSTSGQKISEEIQQSAEQSSKETQSKQKSSQNKMPLRELKLLQKEKGHKLAELMKKRKEQGISSKEGSKKKKTLSQKSGVLFPVNRINRDLKKMFPKNIISKETGIYLGSVLEYLCSEVLDLSGDVALQLKKKRVIPHHILLAINGDEELKKLLNNVTIAQGGVTPFIHPEMMQTRTSRIRRKSVQSDQQEEPEKIKQPQEKQKKKTEKTKEKPTQTEQEESESEEELTEAELEKQKRTEALDEAPNVEYENVQFHRESTPIEENKESEKNKEQDNEIEQEESESEEELTKVELEKQKRTEALDEASSVEYHREGEKNKEQEKEKEDRYAKNVSEKENEKRQAPKRSYTTESELSSNYSEYETDDEIESPKSKRQKSTEELENEARIESEKKQKEKDKEGEKENIQHEPEAIELPIFFESNEKGAVEGISMLRQSLDKNSFLNFESYFNVVASSPELIKNWFDMDESKSSSDVRSKEVLKPLDSNVLINTPIKPNVIFQDKNKNKNK